MPAGDLGGRGDPRDQGVLDDEQVRLLAHELRNTLFAIDMLLERAIDHEELGTDPMADVRRARDGVRETLEVIERHLGA